MVRKCIILLCLLICGCSVYQPEPLDLGRDTEEWLRVSRDVIPFGKALSVEQMRWIGLFLNPELNKARLTWMKSKGAARYAGMWEDPAIQLDGEHVVSEHLYNYDVAPTLSVPVTGVPRLAKRVAELYSEADYLELKAVENEYLARLETLACKIQVTHAKHQLMLARMKEAQKELQDHTKLLQLGEISSADMYNATQRSSTLAKELQELELEHITQHDELLSMLGLHPGVGDIELEQSLPQETPSPVQPPSQEALLNHPRLRAAMAAYNTSEQELRLEIRKQYPVPEINPGFSREDGDDKLTLGVGFTLPLWNRNREAIARAQGNRKIARHTALQQWHELLRRVHTLTRRQKLVHQHCITEFTQLQRLKITVEQQEKLYTMGEMNLPTLAATRHELFSRQLSFLDCLEQLLEIRIAMKMNN